MSNDKDGLVSSKDSTEERHLASQSELILRYETEISKYREELDRLRPGSARPDDTYTFLAGYDAGRQGADVNDALDHGADGLRTGGARPGNCRDRTCEAGVALREEANNWRAMYTDELNRRRRSEAARPDECRKCADPKYCPHPCARLRTAEASTKEKP